MKITYNSNTLVSVKTIDKTHVDYFVYQPEKKRLLFPQKEGFGGILVEFRTKEQLLREGYLIEDNKVYIKPCVKLSFVDGSTQRISFKTYSEALKYADDMVEKYIADHHRIIL